MMSLVEALGDKAQASEIEMVVQVSFHRYRGLKPIFKVRMYRPYTITFLTHEAGHLLLSLHYQETSTSFYPQEHHVIFWALGFSG